MFLTVVPRWESASLSSSKKVSRLGEAFALASEGREGFMCSERRDCGTMSSGSVLTAAAVFMREKNSVSIPGSKSSGSVSVLVANLLGMGLFCSDFSDLLDLFDRFDLFDLFDLEDWVDFADLVDLADEMVCPVVKSTG